MDATWPAFDILVKLVDETPTARCRNPHPRFVAPPRKPHGAEARLEVVSAVCYFKHLIIVSSFQFASNGAVGSPRPRPRLRPRPRPTRPFVFSQSWGCHTSSFVPRKPALDRRGKVKASKEHSREGDREGIRAPRAKIPDPRSERKSEEEGADRRR